MLAVVILTHGKEGLLYSHDSQYSTQLILERFTGENCNTLIGKPKLFFIQACQGTDMDEGVECVRKKDMTVKVLPPIVLLSMQTF